MKRVPNWRSKVDRSQRKTDFLETQLALLRSLSDQNKAQSAMRELRERGGGPLSELGVCPWIL